jgi:twitching motility protein PilU
MDIAELLAFSVKNKASDLHLSAGLPPMIRVDGDVRRINIPALDHKQVHALVYDIMSDKQRRDYEEFLEVDFSFEIPSLARFRVNAFNQNRGAGAVFRTIPSEVLTLEDLACPPLFREVIQQPQGLILVTGPTGSGKSTTLAAMIDYINKNEYGHILTVEDPIEFVHTSQKCLINQREVHRDTHGFNEALRSALREDPDIILVGELRDLETIRLALTAAETGHLVFGTLHTSSAAKTIDRIIDVFPAGEKPMVRSMLSESLRAVISQALLKKVGGGRTAAWEIMVGTPAIRNLIREDKVAQMYSAIQTGQQYGMHDPGPAPAGPGQAQPDHPQPGPRVRQGQAPVRVRRDSTGGVRQCAAVPCRFLHRPFPGTCPWEPAVNTTATTIDFTSFLKLMAHQRASDLFITAGMPPAMKVNGKISPITQTPLTPQQSRDLVLNVMTPAQREEFEKTHECNFAIGLSGVGRFRVSCFYQRNQVGMVLRRIETRIPTVEELSLPPIIKTLAMTKRGIILFVGATGTGKSTSLAAMIGYRNQNSTGHIITIEDPIEFVHKHEGCIITQREVGIDTDSWEAALKNTLRQAPDVIMIGEVRTREGMDHAIAFAETGHLVLCTLHANNANQAMDRIVNFFPEDRRNQLLMDLSLNLKGVVAQQLVPSPDGRSRKVAMEILLGTPLVQDYIRDGEIHKLKEVMKDSVQLGMKTFDQSLFELYQAGEISYEDALRYADSQNEVRLRIKLSQGGDARTLSQGLDGVEISEIR